MTTERPRWQSILAVAAFVATLAATLLVFAEDRIFDADSFATTATATLSDPGVNDYLAEKISEALIEQVPDLAIGGPVLTEVTGAVLQSPPAARVVEASTRETHRAVFERSENTLALQLSDLVVSIDQALTAVSPDLAAAIPEEVSTLSVEISSGEFAADAVRLAERVRILTFLLVAVAALLLVALVVVEGRIFAGLTRMGLVVALVGLFLVVSRGVGATVLSSYGSTPLESAALAGAWNVVLGDLATWGWVMIVIGAISASLGWAVGEAGRLDASLRGLLAHVHSEPSTPVGQAARGAALLSLAWWALVAPGSLLEAAVRCAGLALAIVVLARFIEQSGIAEWLKSREPEPSAVVSPRSLAARAALPALIVLGLGVVGVLLLSQNDNASALFDPDACNGHVELCERPLDEVTMAASHNAMSSTATGFYLPNHLSTIRAQLDHGVRAFMIDTVYGRPATNGTIRTELDLVDVDSLDSEALIAAEAVRARQGADLGDRGVYLCHGFCEIGALDAVDEMRSFRSWLDDNPREVVIFLVQDATAPQDTAALFVEAGFEDLVLTQDLDAPFPTLAEMIDTNRRVFVMVEEDGGDVEWLHPAFEFSQETPFSFASTGEFSCAPNRGDASSPLFVINHFITLARPSNQRINSSEELNTRVADCERERGLQPNLIAVDFATKGEVMAVVDALNGVGD